MPAPSWPRIDGKSPSLSRPSSVYASVWQMPVALISTRTSPVFGPSRSISMISSGFFASKATAARVFIFSFLSRSSTPLDTPLLCSAPSFSAHAGIFGLGVGLGLVLVIGRAHASHRVVGAGTQIDVKVVHVAGHVRIVAEGRHHVLLGATDVLAAAPDHTEEVALAHRRQ